MKKLKIRVHDLEFAFATVSMETHFYLDLTTAGIEMISESTMDSSEIESICAQIDGNPGRYIKIPENEPHEAYETMEEFAEGVVDIKLRDKLFAALENKKPFSRFRAVLERCPEELKEWYEFKDKALRERMTEWLKENEIEPTDV